MTHPPIDHRLWREQRLCRFEAPRSTPQRLRDWIGDKFSSAAGSFDPEVRRERTDQLLADKRKWINAFKKPEIFKEAQKPGVPQDTYGPEELLLHMTVEERKVGFNEFIEELLPRSVLTARGIDFIPDQPEQLTITLNALTLIIGEPVSADMNSPNMKEAISLASDAIRGRLNNLDHRYDGKMRESYIHWLENQNPPPREEQATDTTYVAAALPTGELRGAVALGVLDRPKLQEYYNLYTDRQRMIAAEKGKAHDKQQLLLSRTLREDAEKQGRTFMDNFQSLDPRMQFAFIAGGGALLAAGLFSKNKFFKTISIGLLGTYAYLRLFKGDENAANSIAEGVKTTVNLGIDKGKGGMEWGALKTPSKQEQDRLTLMADFLRKHALFPQFAETCASFGALSQAKLGIIASAFHGTDTNRKDGNRFTGVLAMDDTNGAGGSNFTAHLKQTMDKQGIAPADQRKILDHLRKENVKTSSALFHMFYMLGCIDPEMKPKGKKIDQAVREKSGGKQPSYDYLVGDLRNQYVDIEERGIEMARSGKYANRSFVDVISTLNTQAESQEEKPDTAERITNTRGISPDSFSNLHEIGQSHIDLALNGFVHNDCKEFVKHTKDYHLIDNEAGDLLDRKFTIIRNSANPPNEVIMDIEKLKYAVEYAALREKKLPLKKENIIAIAGNDATIIASQIVNTVANFINTRLITVSSILPMQAENIGSVRALIAERNLQLSDVRSLNGGGLNRLDTQLNDQKKVMDGLRASIDDKVNAMISGPAALLSPPAMKAFHDNPEEFKKALKEQFTKTIYSREKYFAQRGLDSLCVAMLTTHRSSGHHVLNDAPDSRFITPIEEQNIMDEQSMMFEELIGTDGARVWEVKDWSAVVARFSAASSPPAGPVLPSAPPTGPVPAPTPTGPVPAPSTRPSTGPVSAPVPSGTVPSPSIGPVPIPSAGPSTGLVPAPRPSTGPVPSPSAPSTGPLPVPSAGPSTGPVPAPTSRPVPSPSAPPTRPVPTPSSPSTGPVPAPSSRPSTGTVPTPRPSTGPVSPPTPTGPVR